MRAFMLVGTLVALAIAGYLYKSKHRADEANVQKQMQAAGMPAPKNLQEAPKVIGDHMKALQKSQQDAQDAAIEGR